MIVAGIISVVGLALGVAVNNGLTIWERVNSMVLEEDAAIFFSKFTNEIKNVIQYKDLKFEGGDNMFSAPMLINSFEGRVLPGKVIYFFDDREGRIKKRYVDMFQLFQGKTPEAKTILENVSDVKFTYYLFDRQNEVYVWLEEWKEDEWGVVNEDENFLPSAVRMKVTLKKGRDEIDYVKTVNIPVAKTEFEGK
ncbi:MAG: hypothetical protein KAI70_07030 [Candidatus Omnitrophica bacterium]|nr:hypothetical protein [Candidatus Omnitrophota bacterium]